MDWKNFKVKVDTFFKGDDAHTHDEYSELMKDAIMSANKSGTHRFIERDGYYMIEPIPEPTAEEVAEKAMLEAKTERSDAVSKIVVEVDGMKFDGDETSQQRMSRSIVALEDGETMPWVLYDNTVAQVTKEQLRQALRLAGIKQSELWVVPYV